jgi:hypothetical protein
VNKEFWDAWSAPPGMKKNIIPMIDNQKFIMEGHQTRWKEDVMWNRDYVIVPRYVFWPFN